MKYKKSTLPNGLRVVTVPMKGNPSITVMVLVETGSKYESKSENGLSHFLEHMVFKGTKRRPTAKDIGLELESMGAVNNAFTSHEVTGYWAKGNKRHFNKIFDVVSDIYLNPTLPADTLEKERGVILQEISMYEDEPQHKVWDVFSELMYGDTPAGRTITGTKENVKRFKIEDFIKYRDTHYVAGKTIVIVAGDVEHDKVIRETKKYFKDVSVKKKVGKEKVKESQTSPQVKLFKKKTDQTHLVVGLRGFKASDKRAEVLHVISYILGKGSSSRLFQKMREEMGACYYVNASNHTLTDHGAFTISAGIEAKRLEEVVRALLEECKRLINEPVSKAELDKAKEYAIGRLYMTLETSDGLAEFYVEQEITTPKLKTPQEIEREIRAVTPKDIQKVAKEIFRDDRLNLAIVGDVKDTKRIKKVLRFKQ